LAGKPAAIRMDRAAWWPIAVFAGAGRGKRRSVKSAVFWPAPFGGAIAVAIQGSGRLWGRAFAPLFGCFLGSCASGTRLGSRHGPPASSSAAIRALHGWRRGNWACRPAYLHLGAFPISENPSYLPLLSCGSGLRRWGRKIATFAMGVVLSPPISVSSGLWTNLCRPTCDPVEQSVKRARFFDRCGRVIWPGARRRILDGFASPLRRAGFGW